MVGDHRTKNTMSDEETKEWKTAISIRRNWVSKVDLRKLVERWRNESTGSIYKVQTGYCAEELEKLLGGE